MPQTTEYTSIQTIQGPDQKWYKVKAKDQTAFENHFKKQGWIKKSDGWYTQSGEKAKISVPSDTPGFRLNPTAGIGVTGGSGKVVMEDKRKNMSSASRDYIGTSLPTVGGAIGSIFGGGSVGAGVGGAIGEAIRSIIVRPSFMEQAPDTKKEIMNILVEGGKQAGLNYAGEKTGEVFFNLLNKIPHATVKQGIKFLPSETNPGGKVSKYVEDLLSNLAPSAKTMEEFKRQQNVQILKKVDTLVKGMSRMDLTSEQVGVLVRQSMQDGEKSASAQLELLRKSLPKGKQTMGNVAKAFPNEFADFMQNFRNELANKIIRTDKPELIAGWLRQQNTGLEHTRLLTDKLNELSPETLGKVRRRLVSDFLQESLTGSKDPVTKGMSNITQRFAGDKWSNVLNTMGVEKLKAIFGETGYKNLNKFTELTGNLGVNRQGSGVGRFLNLMFLLPFRSGLKIENLTKTGGLAFVMNRAAKIMTSTEGMALYESYIRAIGQNSPRLANLAVDEIKKYNERTDEEFQQEQQESEQLYEQMKEKEKEGVK